MPARVERPLRQRSSKTVFLRVPSQEWPAVNSGRVREFRASIGNVPQLFNVPLPTLVVAYRKRRATGDYEYRLMTLEGIRQEALGAINEEGLRLAGYTGENARARFRRDWMNREKRRFEPLRKVMVFTVRPFTEDDIDLTGRRLVEHLYGEFIAERSGAVKV
jgi:hypothetical protein